MKVKMNIEIPKRHLNRFFRNNRASNVKVNGSLGTIHSYTIRSSFTHSTVRLNRKERERERPSRITRKSDKVINPQCMVEVVEVDMVAGQHHAKRINRSETCQDHFFSISIYLKPYICIIREFLLHFFFHGLDVFHCLNCACDDSSHDFSWCFIYERESL